MILALARTIRCAIVASGTTNARAISVVSSPPSSRRVSATWAVGASAGWQQVKISRSRSSGTGLTSSTVTCAGSAWVASPPGYTSSAWLCRCSRDASRRSQSTARFRPVVMIQPAGLGGRPVSGHFCTATAKASWIASSARSMSPRWRTRLATARPYSARKIRPTSATSHAVMPALVRAVAAPPGHPGERRAARSVTRRPGTAVPRPARGTPGSPWPPTRAPRPGRRP